MVERMLDMALSINKIKLNRAEKQCRPPPPASSEEVELRSAVFCQVTGVHLMCQIFMNDLLTEQGQQRSRGIR